MVKITNPHYRRFLDEGIIETIGRRELKKALNNVKGRHQKEGRALLIILYFSGARPIEALQITPKDVDKKDSYVTVYIRGSKGGLPRTVFLRKDDVLIKEFFDYAKSLFPEMYCFHHYRNNYVRTTINKAGEVKVRVEVSDKLRYHFKQWFKGVVDESIPPYFLRHNRFSKLMQEGVSDKDIQLLKGSRTVESVQPYVHMSVKRARDLAKHFK